MPPDVPTELERLQWGWVHGEDPRPEDGFTRRQLREIERQIEGRPRRALRTNPAHASVLNSLDADLAVTSKTSRGRKVLCSLEADGIDTLGCVTLLELSERLRVGPEGEATHCVLDHVAYLIGGCPDRRLLVTVSLRPALERILSLTCARTKDDEAGYDLLDELHALYAQGHYEIKPMLAELHRSVRRIVDRRSRDAARSTTANVPEEHADPVTDPGNGAIVLLDDALRSEIIDERERALLILCVLEGRSPSELADQFNVPYRTIQSELLRAKKKLAGHLHRGTLP